MSWEDDVDGIVEKRWQNYEPSKGDMIVSDGVGVSSWRIDRIDDIVTEAYNDAIWWHNNRIGEGADPRSGLRSLPYVPWREEIDGVAAMHGNGSYETSADRNGTTPTPAEYRESFKKVLAYRGALYVYVDRTWVAIGNLDDAQVDSFMGVKQGLTCAEGLLILGVAFFLLLFMMIAS